MHFVGVAMWWFLLISPFAVGLFYEWTSGLVAVLFLILLIIKWKKDDWQINLSSTLPLLTTCVVSISYLISAVWAVDRGMSIFGFIKFLPLPLFAAIVESLDEKDRPKMLNAISTSGVFMVIISSLLSFIPVIGGYFTVNNRLAGFFQYPNTFAAYLLAGLILVGHQPLSKINILEISILLFGIVYTESKATLVLLFFLVPIIFILSTEIKNKILWGILTAAEITIAIYMCAKQGADILRFVSSSSTFIGRLLYWKDAIPIILKNLFGLGYTGYKWLQGSFQTGVYSLQYVHNGLLQLLLDIGWIPTGLVAAMVVKSFFSKNLTKTQKLILFFLSAHILFDFDSEFLTIWFVMLLCVDYNPITKKQIKCTAEGFCAAGIGVSLISIYFSAVSFLSYTNFYDAALSLYPAHTISLYEKLQQADTAEEMDEIADRILRVNREVSLAWSAKARVAYSNGDFAKVTEYKEKAISLSKYDLQEYLDYFDMLAVGFNLYNEAGDLASAEVCQSKLKEIPDMLQQVLDDTDKLAWMIDEQPELELPKEYQDILDELQ